MKDKNKITIGITILVALIYTGAIVWWHLYTPHDNLSIQAPGADNRPPGLSRKANDVVIGEYFMKYDDEVISTSLTDKWTNFRGAKSNNIIVTSDKIDTSTKEYPILWSIDTGEGHAAPAIYNGRVYFLDYVEDMNADALRCFSLETGKELWRRWYRTPMKRNHGFSRTIPAIGDNFVITVGPQGHVMCCDPISGDLKWSLDMQKEYATEVPFWYAGQCPIVDNGILVLAPAGKETLMVGLDCLTGEVAWTTPNSIGFKMSHSSVMPMNIANKKTYTYIGIGGVCGVSADEGDKGSLLWSTNKWQPSVVAPSPLQLSANQVFLVAGYGSGGALLQIDNSGSAWKATITDQYRADKGLSAEQQTPILYKGMIISILPKDGGAMRERVACYLPSDLHSTVWTSSSEERFGLGPYLVINNYLLVLKEDGELYVYEILDKSMKLLKKQRIMDGIDAWGPMAYADGKLILRDAHTVKCIKIL